MKPPTRLPTALPLRLGLLPHVRNACCTHPPLVQCAAAVTANHHHQLSNRKSSIHTTARGHANVTPECGIGPVPEPPIVTAVEHTRARIEKRKKQAEMLRIANDGKKGTGTGNGLPRKRFWKEVSVREVDDHLQVFLDARPLRHPTTREIIRLPKSKRTLAAMMAVEWENLTSVQDVTKPHLIPLTSLACRALDIATDDALGDGRPKERDQISSMVLAYLDTDTLLCWAPEPELGDPLVLRNDAGDSLHDVQARTAREIVAYLTRWVWPGVVLKPALPDGSIMPVPQDEEVRDVVRGWVLGLGAWELAGLERAVLAGKGLLVAARLIVEWSEGYGHLRNKVKRELSLSETGHSNDSGCEAEEAMSNGAENQQQAKHKTFGIEEASRAASIEVDWQTQRWGEVEDTHDVQKEDVRRQYGSVVLLVSGTEDESRQ